MMIQVIGETQIDYVCLLATLLKNVLKFFYESFRIGQNWNKEQLLKSWGVLDHQCDPNFFFHFLSRTA